MAGILAPIPDVRWSAVDVLRTAVPFWSILTDRMPVDSTMIVTAIRRGLRKRCPHCGEGRLFSGWSFFDGCSVCGLVFARNSGDTWAFTIFGDRLPLAGMIAVIYFGVLRSHRALGVTMLVALAAVAIWTTPNRWGLGIALHYLSRVYWPDPADPIPPPVATGPRR